MKKTIFPIKRSIMYFLCIALFVNAISLFAIFTESMKGGSSVVSATDDNLRSTTKIHATTYPLTTGTANLTNSNWREAMVSGNGHIGFMNFGDPYHDLFLFQNIYFIRHRYGRDTFNYSKLINELEPARQAVINNDAAAANAAIQGGRSWNYVFHPGQVLGIRQDEKDFSNYSRWTDFETAEVGVSYTDSEGTWERKAFTSRTDDVTIMEISSSSTGSKINLTLTTEDPSFNTQNYSNLPFKKYATVTDDAAYLTYVSHYNGPSNSETHYQGGWGGISYIVTVGGSKEVVALGGTKHGSNVASSSVNYNPGIKITDAQKVYIITKSERDFNMGMRSAFNNQTEFALVDSLLDDTSGVAQKYGSNGTFDYQTALNEHLVKHKTEFNNVKFNLYADENDRERSTNEMNTMLNGDKKMNPAQLERAYNAGRYVELCSSGWMAPRLSGMWTGDWNSGAWACLYTLDANVNLQIAPANTGNMPEAGKGFIYFIMRQFGDWGLNAGWSFGMHDAVQVPCNMDGDRALQCETDKDFPFQFWHAGSSWLLLPIYEYWQCYGNQRIPLPEKYVLDLTLERNRKILGVNDGGLTLAEVDALYERGWLDLEKDILLPMLTKQANYWEQLVTPEYYTDANGMPHYQKGKTSLEEGETYCFIPTYSPENWPQRYNSAITLNATMDIAAARHGLDMVIAMEKVVGREGGEAAVAKWEGLKLKLPPYLLDGEPGSATTSSGGGGALREWATYAYLENNNHRHLSHLYPVWPAYEFRDDEWLRTAARQALENRIRINKGGENTQGHGILHRALAQARLGYGLSVEQDLLSLTQTRTYYDSMVTDHNNNRQHNFCTDTNIGLVAAINESLMFSNTGDIEIFPALMPSLEKGCIKGMMARTRAEMEELKWDMEYGTSKAKIRSEVDQTIKVSCGVPWVLAEVEGNHNAVINNGENVVLQMNAGDVVDILFIHEMTTEILQDKLVKIKEMKKGIYTTASWDVLQNAITDAEKVVAKGSSATAEEMESAFAALQNAIGNLTFITTIDVPTNLILTKTGVDSIRLNWNQVSGAQGYEVWYAKSANGTYEKLVTTAESTYLHNGLKMGETYYYKLRSYMTGEGITIYSDYAKAEFLTLSVPEPAKVRTERAGTNAIKISWNKASGVDGYEIYCAAGKNGKYKRIATVSSKKSSYTNKKLKKGITCYYKLRAYKLVDGEKKYSAYTNTVKGKVLSDPKGVKTKRKSKTSIRVSWNKVKGASKYEIYRAKKKDGKYKKIAAVKPKKSSYTDSKLNINKKYYYKVTAN